VRKARTESLQAAAEKALRSCLETIPFLQLSGLGPPSDKSGPGPELIAKVTSPDGERTLVAELRPNGYPRAARDAVNQLLRYRDQFPGAYLIFIAPYITPQTTEFCQREGVGTLDLAGNCLLSFGRVYVRQEGRPNPFADRRDLRSLYSPKAARVLRVLLVAATRSWKVEDLSKEAQVSIGQVSKVKKLLADREWISSKRGGFKLTQPEELLSEWAENYDFRKNEVQDFYSLKTPTEIESDLDKACRDQGISHALTAFSGTARLAPAIRYQRAVAYVQEIDRIAPLLSLKPVPSGANVTLLTPYDAGVFYGAQEIEGVRIASPVQIYLDLLSFKGRGEEAASTLLEEVIRPSW
jgi:hypothetical protein